MGIQAGIWALRCDTKVMRRGWDVTHLSRDDGDSHTMTDDAPPAYEVVPGANQWQTRDVFSRYYVVAHGTCISNEVEARDRWDSMQTVLLDVCKLWALTYAEQQYKNGTLSPWEQVVCHRIAVAMSPREQYRAMQHLVDRWEDHEECILSYYASGIGGTIDEAPVDVVAGTDVETKPGVVPLMRIVPDDFGVLNIRTQLYILARGVSRDEMRGEWRAKQTEVVEVLRQHMNETLATVTHDAARAIAMEMSRATSMEEQYTVYCKLLTQAMRARCVYEVLCGLQDKLETSRVLQTIPTTVVFYMTRYGADGLTLCTQLWEYWGRQRLASRAPVRHGNGDNTHHQHAPLE